MSRRKELLNEALHMAVEKLADEPYQAYASELDRVLGFSVEAGGREFSCEVQFARHDDGVAALVSIQPSTPGLFELGSGGYFLIRKDGSWTPDGSVAF